MAAVAIITRVVKRSIKQFMSHNCLALSASISFYAMFSFFPLLLLSLSIVVTIGGSSEIAASRLAQMITNMVPVGTGIVVSWIESISQTKPLAWGIGIGGLVWGARHVFNTLALSASIIWARKGLLDVLRRQVVSLLLVAFAACMLLVSVLLPGAMERIFSQGYFDAHMVPTMISFVVPYAISFLTFMMIYLLTTPGKVPHKIIIGGASLVSLVWEIAKNGFLAYIRMTKITSIYGSIGGMIVLMTWIYFSAVIILWGMEVVAVSVETQKDQPHLRRAKGIVIIE